MRRMLLMSCLLAVASTAAGQTPFGSMNAGGAAAPEALGAAANNPWLGSQVAAKIGDSDDLADVFLVSARTFYDIDVGFERFHLPVMANLSPLSQSLPDSASELREQMEDLALSTQGVNIGLYPFMEFALSDFLLITPHGAAAYRLNSFQPPAQGDGDATEKVYLHQFRTSLGVEAALGARSDGDAVLTLSVAPTLSFFSAEKHRQLFGYDESRFAALEITAILPLGDGFGFLAEYVDGEGSVNLFRVGLITAAQKNDVFGSDPQ
jgi:hypothetical protein